MIIVSAGHVDHGKSALIQALTGTNPSHLPEEKKRGMTIDLGYAYVRLHHNTLGFIDVPGHERFLGNMLAGLGGVKYGLLIVSACEGIQKQTEEHLRILQLLDFKIILVITKADRTSTSQSQQLIHTIQQRYPFLSTAPTFITSAYDGQGINELRDYLFHLSTIDEDKKEERPFRYAIDRTFILKGVGLVVTGTAWSGTITLDQELYLSSGKKIKVRHIHAQNQKSSQGRSGERLALNLVGEIKLDDIKRGDWLFDAPPLAPTTRCTLVVTATSVLKENQVVHGYFGASHTTGKLTLLTQKTLLPQEKALAEWVVETPQYFSFADKVILRSGDAKQLLAGGEVIEINSPKRYKRTPERLDYLQKIMACHDVEQRVARYLFQNALEKAVIKWTEQISEQQLNQILVKVGSYQQKEWCFDQNYQQNYTDHALQVLDEYHRQHPDQLGVSKVRLQRMTALHQPKALIFSFIDELIAQQKLMQTRGWIHLPQHKIAFNAQEEVLWQQVQQHFIATQGQAIWVRDMANYVHLDEISMRNFMYKAGKLGYLTPIVKDRFFLTEDIYCYAKLIYQVLEQQESISVMELRDLLKFGRKLTVQLVEYFDRVGFLWRRGNRHFLRDAIFIPFSGV